MAGFRRRNISVLNKEIFIGIGSAYFQNIVLAFFARLRVKRIFAVCCHCFIIEAEAEHIPSIRMRGACAMRAFCHKRKSSYCIVILSAGARVIKVGSSEIVTKFVCKYTEVESVTAGDRACTETTGACNSNSICYSRVLSVVRFIVRVKTKNLRYCCSAATGFITAENKAYCQFISIDIAVFVLIENGEINVFGSRLNTDVKEPKPLVLYCGMNTVYNDVYNAVVGCAVIFFRFIEIEITAGNVLIIRSERSALRRKENRDPFFIFSMAPLFAVGGGVFILHGVLSAAIGVIVHTVAVRVKRRLDNDHQNGRVAVICVVNIRDGICKVSIVCFCRTDKQRANSRNERQHQNHRERDCNRACQKAFSFCVHKIFLSKPKAHSDSL